MQASVTRSITNALKHTLSTRGPLSARRMRGNVAASCRRQQRPENQGAGRGEDPEAGTQSPQQRKCFLKLCLAPGHCLLCRIPAQGEALEGPGGVQRDGSRWTAQRTRGARAGSPSDTGCFVPPPPHSPEVLGQDSGGCGHLGCCVDRARSPRPTMWGRDGAETPTPRERGGQGSGHAETDRWRARRGLP